MIKKLKTNIIERLGEMYPPNISSIHFSYILQPYYDEDIIYAKHEHKLEKRWRI